jgi:sugar lactone lactonase YvrE
VYVAEIGNHAIRKISNGVVSTLAGSGTAGYADGSGTAASFNSPHGVAVDSAGWVYVADACNHRIRKISPQGMVSTFAGSGATGSGNGGYADGTATAKFNAPCGVAVDSYGWVYVADTSNYRIRKISPDGVVSTLAGSGTFGYAEGSGTDAQFKSLWGVAVDSAGNVYVGEAGNDRIRKLRAP